MLKKIQSKNKPIQWQIGSAENTGLRQHSIDGIIATLTFHPQSHLTGATANLNKVEKGFA